jgi:hypothetical protein
MLRWFSRRSALADEHTAGDAPAEPGLTPDRLAALYAGLRPGDRATSADFALAALEMRRRAGHRWWPPVSWLVCSLRTGRAAAWFAVLAALVAAAVLWTSAGHGTAMPH